MTKHHRDYTATVNASTYCPASCGAPPLDRLHPRRQQTERKIRMHQALPCGPARADRLHRLAAHHDHVRAVLRRAR
jgi:hypothetical protein